MFNLQVATAVLVLCISSGVLCEKLCLEGDFDSQLQTILHKYTLTPHDITRVFRVFDDLRNTLSKRWTGIELIPFGSLVTGLGTNASDIDIYVRLPNYNSSEEVYDIEETGRLLEKEPTLYSQLILRTTRRVRVLTFFYIPSQISCDILFKSWDGVVNSKIVGYYFKSDKRFQPLGIFIKFWANIHNIIEHHTDTGFRNYALYLLIIFYLQQKKMVPSGFELQKDFDGSNADAWITDFKEIPYSSNNNTESLYQLIGGFFKYYSEFNFDKHIISPFAGRPINKTEFEDAITVPEEFSRYKDNIKTGNIRPLVLNTDICIQDIIKHNRNMVAWVRQERTSKLLYYVKIAAKMFMELPKDHFLSALLDTDRQNKTSIISQMSKQKDCINV